MSNSVEGYGSITWWGFSPAVDLADLSRDSGADSECDNILVVGSGDLRHVLKTLAHSTKPLHFYVAECSLEMLARHMMFLTLISEPINKLGLQERSELFLELYGNTLIRHQTAQWLAEKATQLIRMVTDLDYQKAILPLLDLSLLKFKERDMLEGIFKFWRMPETSTFDIQRHWEGRLRHHLGARYDSRSGVFDWDYHMKLQELATVVSSREYQCWRQSGVAFQLREDAPYQCPNRTIASGLIIKQGGEKVARRGYWGDIISSPYIALGIESDNNELFCKANTKHIKNSLDVSVWNTQWLLGTLIGADHLPAKGTTQRSECVPLPATIQELDEEVDSNPTEVTNTLSQNGPLYMGSRITFLPLQSVSELGRKARFKNLFNTAYFSNSMVHLLTSGVEATFSPQCSLLLETARFMLELKKEQKLEYIKKVTAMANSIGYSNELHHSQVEDASVLVFWNKNSE